MIPNYATYRELAVLGHWRTYRTLKMWKEVPDILCLGAIQTSERKRVRKGSNFSAYPNKSVRTVRHWWTPGRNGSSQRGHKHKCTSGRSVEMCGNGTPLTPLTDKGIRCLRSSNQLWCAGLKKRNREILDALISQVFRELQRNCFQN